MPFCGLIDHLFLLLNNTPFHVIYMVFVNPFNLLKGVLVASFQLLAIINKAAICVHVHVYIRYTFSNSLGKYLRMRLLHHMVKTLFSFARNCQTVFQYHYTILHFHQQWITFSFPSGIPITCIYTFCNCPTVQHIVFKIFVFSFLLSLHFSLGSIYGHILNLTDFFLIGGAHSS